MGGRPRSVLPIGGASTSCRHPGSVTSRPHLSSSSARTPDSAERSPTISRSRVKKHWVTTETSDDEIIERYESGLDNAVATQRYWSSIRNRAQELFDEPVVPGTHYALTEVVRCASVNEQKGDVLTAARFCHKKWLMPTLKASGARVVIGVGKHAMRTLPKVLPGIDPEGGVQEVDIADRAVLVSFLHGPGSGSRRRSRRLTAQRSGSASEPLCAQRSAKRHRARGRAMDYGRALVPCRARDDLAVREKGLPGSVGHTARFDA